MKTVWKYELLEVEHQKLDLPIEAEILSAHLQNNKICLWALVDPKQKTESILFRMLGTGQDFEGPSDEWSFVGTIFVGSDADFVFHIWRIRSV